MVSLVDLVPAAASVSVRGQDVPVQGVNAKGIGVLLGRFPELRALMSGRSVEPASLFAMGGDVVAAIIAAGTGHPGEPEHEAAANTLSVDEQADFLSEILRLTMPQGVGPFVDKVMKMGGLIGVEAVSAPAGKAPASKSPKASKP